jgi:hypothetical protein
MNCPYFLFKSLFYIYIYISKIMPPKTALLQTLTIETQLINYLVELLLASLRFTYMLCYKAHLILQFKVSPVARRVDNRPKLINVIVYSIYCVPCLSNQTLLTLYLFRKQFIVFFERIHKSFKRSSLSIILLLSFCDSL